jgi:lysozyme
MNDIPRICLIILIIYLFAPSVFSIKSDTINTYYECVYGIDVSAWQETINWSLVDNDEYHFCFVKATEGIGWKDPYFETNMVQGNNAGVFMGAYHFATPSLDDAIEEAKFFIATAGKYITDGFLRPVLDLEQGSSLGMAVLSNWVHTWMQTVEYYTDVEPIIYVNSNYANNYLDTSIAEYDLWIAHWTYDPTEMPNVGIWEKWSFWQYSDKGMVNGISGYVDLNVFNGDRTLLESFCIKDDRIYVDDDAEPDWYDATHVRTIQEGVDNATDGDKVLVYGGIYVENVIVGSSISLIGEENNYPIIDGGSSGNGILVEGSEVSVQGFIIRQDELNDDSGIKMIGDNGVIWGNIIEMCHKGIYLNNVSSCTLENNSISSCSIGMYLYNSNKNMIRMNSVVGCGTAIYIEESTTNIVLSNAIKWNSRGVFCSYATENQVLCNNFLDNEEHAKFTKYFSIGFLKPNTWKNNYWDNWIGIGAKVIPGLAYIPINKDPIGYFLPYIELDWNPKQKPF